MKMQSSGASKCNLTSESDTEITKGDDEGARMTFASLTSPLKDVFAATALAADAAAAAEINSGCSGDE